MNEHWLPENRIKRYLDGAFPEGSQRRRTKKEKKYPKSRFQLRLPISGSLPVGPEPETHQEEMEREIHLCITRLQITFHAEQRFLLEECDGLEAADATEKSAQRAVAAEKIRRFRLQVERRIAELMNDLKVRRKDDE